MARIGVLHKVDDPIWNFGLNSKETTIGRGLGCDIRLDNPHVSRIHVTIVRDKGGFILHDKSSNGTFIQPSNLLFGLRKPKTRKVDVHALTNGDTILLGRDHEKFIFKEFDSKNETTGEETRILHSASILNSVRKLVPEVEIIGHSASLARPCNLAEKAMRTKATVLITGETGTGKGLFARRIHNGSSRSKKNFVDVNCGALPSALIESELFGHESGAYTGAQGRRIGRFELANGGTIFLDEIGDLPHECQVKLLHVLEGRGLQRLGSSKTISIDVRIIAATKCNLLELMKEKRFREDLYYRLNVLHIHLPPLRDRVEDIPALVDYFIKKCCKEINRPVCRISEQAVEHLTHYPYSGNIRELANIIERTIIGTDGQDIEAEDLSFISETWDGHETTLVDGSSAFLEEQTMVNLKEALKRSKGIKRHAASRLEISPSTLYKWLKKFNLDPTRWNEW